MHCSIPEELQMIRDNTRRFVKEVLIPREKEVMDSGIVPGDIIRQMKEMGYYGITIPEKYGGMGIGLLGYVLVLQELNQAHPAFHSEISLNNGLGKGPIYYFGSEDQKNEYLLRFASGEYTCAFALTEPNAGSDVSGIKTYAVKKSNSWVINGSKHFITNGANADVVIVMAVTDKNKGTRGGITAFLVKKGTAGFSAPNLQRTMAGPPDEQAELYFDDCVVPEMNVVGEVGMGFKIAMHTLDEGRIHVAAMALGTAKRLLDLSVQYANERVQFGRPIADFQAIQFMLAEMATELYAAEQITYHAASSLENDPKASMECAMAKLFASQMANRVADRAVQLHGGMGYMSEHPVERIYRQVRLFRIVEGTDEIQKIVIARNLLKK